MEKVLFLQVNLLLNLKERDQFERMCDYQTELNKTANFAFDKVNPLPVKKSLEEFLQQMNQFYARFLGYDMFQPLDTKFIIFVLDLFDIAPEFGEDLIFFFDFIFGRCLYVIFNYFIY